MTLHVSQVLSHHQKTTDNTLDHGIPWQLVIIGAAYNSIHTNLQLKQNKS